MRKLFIAKRIVKFVAIATASYKKKFIDAACLTLSITHKAAERLYHEQKSDYGYIKAIIRNAVAQSQSET